MGFSSSKLGQMTFGPTKGTSYIGLFYPYASQNGLNPMSFEDACLVGYANAGYMSDPHKACPKLVMSYHWEYDDILEV